MKVELDQHIAHYSNYLIKVLIIIKLTIDKQQFLQHLLSPLVTNIELIKFSGI